MPDAQALAKVRPWIATPSYTGGLTTGYVRSLLGLVGQAYAHGFAMNTRFLDGDSLVPRARNRMAAEFLADARWTHLFWIDADIGFEPESALRLLSSGHDVVAGVYPHKIDGWPAQGLEAPLPAGSHREDFEARYASFPANLLRHSPAEVDADGFLEVLDAPTGFMLIARHVLERMARELPELRYTPDTSGHPSLAGSQPASLAHHRFFDVMAEPANGRYLSEDYAFCRRWQSIGGKVHVDTRSRLTHQGHKVYTGDFGLALGVRGG
ncbi:hypothetical protein QTH91_10485 [Variovorax dokdonensis]|uniref:Glycosyltransferase n=1 Tax=Variovorax dokdonensis TaxID=344883 RepID=A0ABT7NAE5_9BURK|nr:hypothetical protein [Variovorax dokdonensis]MDM0044912.1 hypothetical protein [Variovorax dokdonensis]